MSVGLTIPLHVACELGCPPCSIAGRRCLVFGAPVPEAPVDEDGNLRTGEQDVRAAPRHSRQGVVDAVSEPQSMEFATKEHFGLGVASGLPGHSGRRCGKHVRER